MILAIAEVTWERDNVGGSKVVLGGSESGSVCAGTLRGQPVAIQSVEFRWGGEEEWMAMTRMRYNMSCSRVVAVHGVIVGRADGDTGATHHLVMERMAGSLAQQMLWPGSPHAGAALGLRLQLLADVASGLAYLHAGGLIHANVKPESVLLTAVTRQSPYPVAKLTNFGSSVARDADADVRTGARGTPMYMDPCLLDGVATPASDVYSFGVMAWQVLTGCVPYEAEIMSAMPATATGRPPVAALVERGVPSDVVAVVEACWARTQGDRPAMAEVARVLEAAAEVEGLGVVDGGDSDGRDDGAGAAPAADDERAGEPGV